MALRFLIVVLIYLSLATGVSLAVCYCDWGQWSSCSSACGGGQHTRFHSRCSYYYNWYDWYSNCYQYAQDYQESRCCGTTCYNGGTWTYLDRSKCTGHCTCPQGYKGICCQTGCKAIPNCLPNEVQCDFIGERCLKCRPPYIASDSTGTCRLPVCKPSCENNGACIADDTCDCAPGYLGERCHLGGSIDSYLLPTLNATQTKPFHELSWYDRPEFSDFGRVCYIKIQVKNAARETLMTAESFSSDGKSFGDFTSGPIDSSGGINSTERTACLQMRCPSDAKYTKSQNISVLIHPITRSGRCNVTDRTSRLNVSVYQNPTSHDVITVHANFGNNYGPAYGIYFGMGTRDNAIFASRQQCLSGTNFNVNDINTFKGVLATYQC